MVTAGFYYLPAAIFDLAPRARAEGLDAMRKLLAMAVASGIRLAAVELRGDDRRRRVGRPCRRARDGRRR